MTLTPDFHPCEILCIEHEDAYLYSEVIQVSSVRQFCWVRPVVLKVVLDEQFEQAVHHTAQESILHDLRQGSDLLMPKGLFRAALDTEVIPLLTALGESKSQPGSERIAHIQLQEFVRRVWQAHPDAFPA